MPAKVGQPVFQGDTIETDADGSGGLVFADNSTFSLADEGRIVIDEMVYDAGSQQGASMFNVTQGVFTFVSGQIAKTDVDAMVIKTATSTIGVRGTSGGGRAAPEGETNTFTLFADPDGTVGEATMTTQVGTQILNQVNQTTLIKSAFQPPSRPVVMPPQVVARFYAKASEALPPSPVDGSGPDGQPGAQTDGLTDGATGAPVEGEGTQEGQTEAGAEAEQQAETLGEPGVGPGGEPLPPGDLAPDGEPDTLADGPVDGNPDSVSDGAVGPDGDILGRGPSPDGPGDGDQIEQVAFAAADEAARQALAGGASLEQAQQVSQQAALTAAGADLERHLQSAAARGSVRVRRYSAPRPAVRRRRPAERGLHRQARPAGAVLHGSGGLAGPPVGGAGARR
ncbi:MAG: FecR domain-containing protein [Rhodospirillaceae bacterium]